jgi:hypothetical protein
MTPDERTLLGRFLQDLAASRGGPKDAEAAELIDRSVRTNPDAAYLLVQHALIADQALHAAQAQIAALEARAPSPAQGGGFLGAGPWAGQPQTAVPPASAPSPAYAPAPGYTPQPARGGLLGGLFGGGQAAPAQTGGFGSFLRQAGTTAAGVAGGEMLFGGLSNLFGGHRGFGFGGGPQEVIVNDYGGGYGPNPGVDPGFDPGQGGYDDGGFDDGGYDDGGVS